MINLLLFGIAFNTEITKKMWSSKKCVHFLSSLWYPPVGLVRKTFSIFHRRLIFHFSHRGWKSFSTVVTQHYHQVISSSLPDSRDDKFLSTKTNIFITLSSPHQRLRKLMHFFAQKDSPANIFITQPRAEMNSSSDSICFHTSLYEENNIFRF